MRFGISATSLIDPKNFLTRLRPVNVCAIVFSLDSRCRGAASWAPLQTAASNRDHRDRRRNRPVLCDSGGTRTVALFTSHRGHVAPDAMVSTGGVAARRLACPKAGKVPDFRHTRP